MEHGSNYGFYLMIEQLSEKFQNSNFICFEENVERYIAFSVVLGIYKKGQKNPEKIIKYDLKFVDSCRFMQVSLSDLTKNLHQKNFLPVEASITIYQTKLEKNVN